MPNPLDPGYPINPDALTVFLAQLGKVNPKAQAVYAEALNNFAKTDDGSKVMELLEKAVLLSSPPPGCSDCALRELHGQRLLISEIRRYAIYGGRPNND